MNHSELEAKALALVNRARQAAGRQKIAWMLPGKRRVPRQCALTLALSQEGIGGYYAIGYESLTSDDPKLVAACAKAWGTTTYTGLSAIGLSVVLLPSELTAFAKLFDKGEFPHLIAERKACELPSSSFGTA